MIPIPTTTPNDAVLIQQVKSNSDFAGLLEITFARHVRYCRTAKMDYRLTVGGDIAAAWEKVGLILTALKDGYRHVIWLDADAMILDITVDLRSFCVSPINAVVFPLSYPHINVGALYFCGGPEAIRFVEAWAAGYPGEDPEWEQRVFNHLAMSDEHNPHVNVLPAECNSVDMLSPCADPVVKAWHGYSTRGGLHVIREAMQKELGDYKKPNWIGL